ncbi:MAG: hypothetical protein WBF24_18895 [Xanthobacteraceae bacterium]
MKRYAASDVLSVSGLVDLRIPVRICSAPQRRQAYTVSSTSTEIGWRAVKTMRPAHTGQGIISEGRLDAV